MKVIVCIKIQKVDTTLGYLRTRDALFRLSRTEYLVVSLTQNL